MEIQERRGEQLREGDHVRVSFDGVVMRMFSVRCELQGLLEAVTYGLIERPLRASKLIRAIAVRTHARVMITGGVGVVVVIVEIIGDDRDD